MSNPTTTTSVVHVSELHRSYGRGDSAVHALQGASFDVGASEMVALIGPSGSGKTTLLNCVLGLDRPDRGDITVFGTNVVDLSYEQAVSWRRDDVSVAFQNPGLLPHLSARENVDVALRMRNVGRSERARRTNEAFEQLGIGQFHAHLPSELSGGQRQRVSIARALVLKPKLFVADEPTGELDSDTTAAMLEVLRAASHVQGMTMILATHDPDVEAAADRTLRMVDGQVA